MPSDSREKLRNAIDAHQFDGPAPVTCSFGVTQFDIQDTAESLIAREDTALYDAEICENEGKHRRKKEGRGPSPYIECKSWDV